MSNDNRPSIWQRIRTSLRNLKEEMYQQSVAGSPPTEAACCHKPVEELERDRERYRKIAEQRKQRNAAE